MKTEKIQENVKCITAGFACIGTMPWESPYIKLQLSDGRVVRWHSDRMEEILHRYGLDHSSISGKELKFSGFIRNGKVWRVNQITQ